MENNVNNVMSNGRIHQDGPPPSQRFKSFERSKGTERIPVVEERNWLLHRLYLRLEFSKCREIIKDELEKWGGETYFPNFVEGLILRREGKVQDSLESFQACYRIDPKSADSVKEIAKSMFLLGNHKKAIELYHESMKMSGQDDWILLLNLGECYMKVNQFDNARTYLKKACELTDNENPYLMLVKLYVMENRLIDAIAVYTEALKKAPESDQVPTELGLTYLKMGDTKRAFQQFGTALAQTPNHAKAIIPMAYLMQSNGEFDVAFSKYKVAAQSMSESWVLWNNIGMCLYGKQKYVSAITCLKKAHYLNPLALEAACNLGIVFLATGQPASAAIYLCGAVTAGPKNPLPYMLLGMALKKLDDLDGAEKALEKAHTLDPQDPQVLVNYAVVLDARQKQAKARELLAVLSDVAALIEVDPQITGMAKQLAAKLRTDDGTSFNPQFSNATASASATTIAAATITASSLQEEEEEEEEERVLSEDEV